MLEASYTVDRRLLAPPPQIIAIIDDVLTTGAHFVAVRNILRQVFPETKIIGLFIARRVPEAVDIEDVLKGSAMIGREQEPRLYRATRVTAGATAAWFSAG